MNMMFGDTELVEEVTNGDVASATDAASEGKGSARLAANIRFRKWRELQRAFRWLFMFDS